MGARRWRRRRRRRRRVGGICCSLHRRSGNSETTLSVKNALAASPDSADRNSRDDKKHMPGITTTYQQPLLRHQADWELRSGRFRTVSSETSERS